MEPSPIEPRAAPQTGPWHPDALIRPVLLGVLLVWCLSLLRPFFFPIVWALILAIGLYPVFRFFERILGGRKGLAAGVVVLLCLVAILLPALVLSGTVVEDAELLLRAFQRDSISLPALPESVLALPVVGESLGASWQQTSQHLEASLLKMAPELRSVAEWLLARAAGAGIGLLEFLVGIFLAGFILANTEEGRSKVRSIALRLAGDRGEALLALVGATVRGVIRGILGVALIQASLAGIAWVIAGVPAAGLWALLALVLCAVQIGMLPISAGILLYVYFNDSTLTFVLLLVWSLIVGALEHVLKPLLLGRGVDVPMGVIFVGAIGGFVTTGVLGLFVGAVVMVLGYSLFDAWLEEGRARSVESDPVAEGRDKT